MNSESRLVKKTTEYIKCGRFECTVTREFYDGKEEREAQIKALRFIKGLPDKNNEEVLKK